MFYIWDMKNGQTSETRQRIIDTASRLFYTQGYNSTGINQIIEEAKVAKASLYQYFPSKEDLLAEYLDNTAMSTSITLHKVIAKVENPKEKVMAIFDFILRFTKSAEFEGCNFLNIVSEVPTENLRIREIIRKQKDSIKDLFADTLKPVGKQDLAESLYLLFDGALVASKVHNSSWPVQTAKSVAEKLL